jgi:myosin V
MIEFIDFLSIILQAIFHKKYFTSNCSSALNNTLDVKIEASNFVLEAFGNAKIICNNNASRYVKLINIGFSKDNELIKPSIKTYLLEIPRFALNFSSI